MIGPDAPFAGPVPRELAAYQDEPKQLATGSPGKNGYLRMGFERRGGKTVLADLERRAPLLVQQALYWDEGMPEMPCVFMISNAGGVLQGDRNTVAIRLGPDASAHVTTQSATKIHEMDANHAAQRQEIVLEERAYLEYLPDQTIPHRHSRYRTDTRLVVHPTATLLYGEVLMAGRKYYRDGERYAYDVFSSRVAASRPEGRELFVEKFVIEPARSDVGLVGVLGEWDVFGNVLLLAPKEHVDAIAPQLPSGMDQSGGWAASASRLPNSAGLVFKVLGMEYEPVRDVIRRLWAVVRREIAGREVPKQFAWR
jgi:urease accessory protein